MKVELTDDSINEIVVSEMRLLVKAPLDMVLDGGDEAKKLKKAAFVILSYFT